MSYLMADGGLQIRTSLPHGLQIPADKKWRGCWMLCAEKSSGKTIIRIGKDGGFPTSSRQTYRLFARQNCFGLRTTKWNYKDFS